MTFEDIKNAVQNVAKEFNITRATLFGSRANGTFRQDSDVDLIVEFGKPVTLITLALISQQLENALGVSVDIVHGPLQSTDFLEIDKEIEIYAA